MPRDRRIYPNPPIVEAVVELRFEGGVPWTPEVRAAVKARLPAYSGAPRASQQIELHAALAEGSVTTGARTTLQAVLYPSANGSSLVGLGTGHVSVHALAPYPSWETFLERIEAAVAAYTEVVTPTSISQVAVRYIDRVKLPGGVESLADYFVGIPARPETMPAKLAAFHVVLQAVDEDGTLALLTLSTAVPDADQRPIILYDLNLVRGLPAATPIAGWRGQVEDLHARQRDIFEDSITDKTRELFR